MLRLFFALICLLPTGALANLPENDLHFEDDAFFISDIDEDFFSAAIEELQSLYGPIAKNLGYNLEIAGDWSDSTVNAYTYREGSTWHVQMFGGLARRPEITKDGFRLVICHELAHQFGGYPMAGWAAFEGQSDYAGAMVCGRKAFALQSADEIEKVDLCKPLATEYERAVCSRTLAASKSLATLLAALRRSPAPKFETPDRTVVSKTQQAHPAAQCRLDTYLAGTLCAKPWNDGEIPKKDGAVCPTRPKCWFKN